MEARILPSSTTMGVNMAAMGSGGGMAMSAGISGNDIPGHSWHLRYESGLGMFDLEID